MSKLERGSRAFLPRSGILFGFFGVAREYKAIMYKQTKRRQRERLSTTLVYFIKYLSRLGLYLTVSHKIESTAPSRLSRSQINRVLSTQDSRAHTALSGLLQHAIAARTPEHSSQLPAPARPLVA